MNRYSLLLRKESVFCKHVLAARLATAMDIASVKRVSDEEMMNIIDSIE